MSTFGQYDLVNVAITQTKAPLNKQKNSFQKRSLISKILYIVCTAIIILGVVWMVFPYLWMFLCSLKTDAELNASGSNLHFFPSIPQWGVFKNLFEKTNFTRSMLNTLIIEISVIPVGTFTSSLAAFAFAKMKFRFKKVILITLMTAMMIPYCSIMFTQFEMFESLGMVGSEAPFPLLPFIIPGMFSRCSMIFFLTTYMKNGIHDSIIESAKIDGASFFRMYWQFALPLAKGAIAAQMIFWFVAIWNDYFAPSIYLMNNGQWGTLQVELMNLYGTTAGAIGKNVMFAGSFIGSVPMIIFFLVFRNMFVRSTSLSGVKE